jgi:hypothetical protein
MLLLEVSPFFLRFRLSSDESGDCSVSVGVSSESMLVESERLSSEQL